MKEYFDEPDRANRNRELLAENRLPLVPFQHSWEVVMNPERLVKTYLLDTRQRLLDFILEIMSHEDHINHHGKITIDHLSVEVEISTKDLNRITNLDREYSAAIDSIYEDVKNYGYGEKRFS